MNGPSAENAYLFRHAVLRDAAYQLQPPADRARLHRLALDSLEGFMGGRPPECGVGLEDGTFASHPCDPIAMQLADHAGLAQTDTVEATVLVALRGLYLHRAAEYAEQQHLYRQAHQLWSALAALAAPLARPRCLLRSALAAGKAGDNTAAVALLEAINSEDLPADPALRCMLHLRLSHFRRELGRLAEAETAALQALSLARADGLALQEAYALGNLSNVQRDTGRPIEAEQGYQQALTVFEQLGNQRYAAVALANVAAMRQLAGDVAAAEQQYRRALHLSRACGDVRFEGITLGNLAIVLQQCRRYT